MHSPRSPLPCHTHTIHNLYEHLENAWCSAREVGRVGSGGPFLCPEHSHCSSAVGGGWDSPEGRGAPGTAVAAVRPVPACPGLLPHCLTNQGSCPWRTACRCLLSTAAVLEGQTFCPSSLRMVLQGQGEDASRTSPGTSGVVGMTTGERRPAGPGLLFCPVAGRGSSGTQPCLQLGAAAWLPSRRTAQCPLPCHQHEGL